MRRAAVAVLSLSLSIPSAFVPFALLRTDRRTSHARSLLSRTLTHSKNAYAFGNADTSMLLSLSLSLFQARVDSIPPLFTGASEIRNPFRNPLFVVSNWNFEIGRIDSRGQVGISNYLERSIIANELRAITKSIGACTPFNVQGQNRGSKKNPRLTQSATDFSSLFVRPFSPFPPLRVIRVSLFFLLFFPLRRKFLPPSSECATESPCPLERKRKPRLLFPSRTFVSSRIRPRSIPLRDGGTKRFETNEARQMSRDRRIPSRIPSRVPFASVRGMSAIETRRRGEETPRDRYLRVSEREREGEGEERNGTRCEGNIFGMADREKGGEKRTQDARTSRAPVGLSVGRSMVRV